MRTDEDAVRDTAETLQRAVATNDVATMGRLLADDWVLVDRDGVGSRRRFLRLVESGTLAHSAMDTVAGTERIVVYGDTAVRTARVTNTAHFDGRRFDADEWTTDVFVRTVDGWSCVLSQVTPVSE